MDFISLLAQTDTIVVEDVQIISCAGKPAQQDVFHLHFHIVPRYKDDGQDVVWQTHPEYRERFDRLIERLL